MALINCPECGREISDKAVACPNCGCPSSEWEKKEVQFSSEKSMDEIAIEAIRKYPANEKVKMIAEVREKTGLKLKEAKELVERNLSIALSSDPFKNNKSQNTLKQIPNDILESLYDESNGNRIALIRLIGIKYNIELSDSKEIVDKFWSEKFPEKKLYYTKQSDTPSSQATTSESQKHEFHGIYRYGLFGGKYEVYCPRCGSENCSYYQEQKIIPGKTKTRYTANLNPLKPFTLVNKKEKVVKKDKTVTESKIMCNDCGNIFE